MSKLEAHYQAIEDAKRAEVLKDYNRMVDIINTVVPLLTAALHKKPLEDASYYTISHEDTKRHICWFLYSATHNGPSIVLLEDGRMRNVYQGVSREYETDLVFTRAKTFAEVDGLLHRWGGRFLENLPKICEKFSIGYDYRWGVSEASVAQEEARRLEEAAAAKKPRGIFNRLFG